MMNKNTQRGFTLIELLVVVLIIGILAAVALPQYQIAITKAQLSRYLGLATSMVEAQEIYYLANGTYTSNLKDLDIDLPQECKQVSEQVNFFRCDNNFAIALFGSNLGVIDIRYCSDNNNLCAATRLFEVTFGFAHGSFPNTRNCNIYNDSSLGKKICGSLALN